MTTQDHRDPGLEGLTLATWLWETFTGDQDLQDRAGGPEALQARVTDGTLQGPDPEWWIEFTILTPRDVKVADMVQVMATVEVLVKVIAPSLSYAPLEPVYRRVHALLEGRTSQVAGQGQVLTCHRVSGVQYPERTDGIEYRHLGGLYETQTQ